MARSRSKQSRSRKASRKASRSSKSGRRSHHQRSSGESGLSRVLKLAERDYMIQTLDGAITPLAGGKVPGIDFASEYIPLLDASGKPITDLKDPSGLGIKTTKKDLTFWKSFSLPELQAGYLQYVAQGKQLEKLNNVYNLYMSNVTNVQGALQKALTDKYNESIKLNQAIAAGLNPTSGLAKDVKLPMVTAYDFREAQYKADLKEALTKKMAAIDRFSKML